MNVLDKVYIKPKESMHRIIIRLNEPTIILSYSILLSLLFLLLCTKSSPLYPFNDWVDANAFFTMGKSMINGKVLYRDIFEQKGPLLYLMHAIAYLISNRSFLGVFILEVISFSIFLFYSHRVISLFIENKYSYISLPLIAAVVLNLKSFRHGDSAEEFCLPLLAIGIYCLIRYFKLIYPDFISYKYMFSNGIIAGCVLWIKYSMLGFWFGLILMLFVGMIVNKHYKQAFTGSILFLGGMFAATIPWIIYFGINNSIYPWLDTYIFTNVKFYTNDLNLISRILFTFKNLLVNCKDNFIFGIISCIGILAITFSKKYIKNNPGKISLPVCGFLLALGVYAGGRSYRYYFLIFAPFVVFGFVAILDFVRVKYDNLIKKAIAINIILIATMLSLSLLFNPNTKMLKVNREDLVQYKFAKIISQTNNATLLNYGALDMGLYTVTGIIPNIKFFQGQNIDYSKYPLIRDEQNRYIKNKEVEYIVIRQKKANEPVVNCIPFLSDNYVVISEQIQNFEDIEFKYILFKRK